MKNKIGIVQCIAPGECAPDPAEVVPLAEVSPGQQSPELPGREGRQPGCVAGKSQLLPGRKYAVGPVHVKLGQRLEVSGRTLYHPDHRWTQRSDPRQHNQAAGLGKVHIAASDLSQLVEVAVLRGAAPVQPHKLGMGPFSHTGLL
eukprot:scaffold632455_cov29-Prasinocladus_malaysianus.AAC.1